MSMANDKYKYVIENGPGLKGSVLVVDWDQLFMVFGIPLSPVLLVTLISGLVLGSKYLIMWLIDWVKFVAQFYQYGWMLLLSMTFPIVSMVTIPLVLADGVGIDFYPVKPVNKRRRRGR